MIGKPGKSQQGKEHPVVLQDFGLVDSSQSGHDGVKKSKDQIGREITGMALRNLDIFLNSPAQFELAAKTLQKDHSPEVS